MMVVKNILLTVLILSGVNAMGQSGITDSTKYSLLINPFIQIESTEAIDAMYNFEFEKAHSHFHYLQKQYPWHPLPYLLKSLNYWWQIVPNYDNEAYDEPFLAYIDSTKYLAKRFKDFNQIESSFFLAAAYAFEGRLYSERRAYRKAAFASKSALKYLDECRGYETYSPELLFGDALYNYYAEWIREEYPAVKPIMWFFPEGDKKKGIAQLKEVASNSFYTRTEAQYYLMRILNSEEHNVSAALEVSKYLIEHYPDNAYFERYHSRLLYQSGRYDQCEEVALSIIDKLEKGYRGYEANSARYAYFFLAHINEVKENATYAKMYYEKGMEYARQVGAEDKGYYHYSLLHLGMIEQKEGNNEQAIEYYKKAKKLTNKKSKINKEARKRLKEIS